MGEMTECGSYAGESYPNASACEAACMGVGLDVCPPGGTMFDPPASGLACHIRMIYGPDAKDGFTYSIVDEVVVPDDLTPGDYLLSWRWDSEHSPQVWQNCADIRVTEESASA